MSKARTAVTLVEVITGSDADGDILHLQNADRSAVVRALRAAGFEFAGIAEPEGAAVAINTVVRTPIRGSADGCTAVVGETQHFCLPDASHDDTIEALGAAGFEQVFSIPELFDKLQARESPN